MFHVKHFCSLPGPRIRYRVPLGGTLAMQIAEYDLKHPFRVLLDDLTMARLLELADVCQCEPSQVISAIVKDVLEDDARAHDGALTPISLQ